MDNDLTPKQKELLVFLKDFIKEKGFPPTLREIATNFGLKGPRGPQKMLNLLEKKGFIRKRKGGSRAIEILEPFTKETFRIPILGRVKAGEPGFTVENIEGYMEVDRDFVTSNGAFLLKVQGDSMKEAHILDGDYALVKPQSVADNGQIVVALIDDEATIKRLFLLQDLIRLEPANPNMEPIVVKKGEKQVSIVGKVIGIFRKL